MRVCVGGNIVAVVRQLSLCLTVCVALTMPPKRNTMTGLINSIRLPPQVLLLLLPIVVVALCCCGGCCCAAVAATSHIIEYKPLHLSALSIKMANLQIKKAHVDTPTPFQNQLRPGKRIERKLRSNIQRRGCNRGREGEEQRERKRNSLSVANGDARHYHGSLKFRRAFKWRWAEMTSKKKKKQQQQ